jgi:hypothetical protein
MKENIIEEQHLHSDIPYGKNKVITEGANQTADRLAFV